MRRLLRRPSPATVIAFVSLLVALTSSAYGAGLITGKNVKDGSLTGADIQNGTLGSRDVHNGTLSGDDVAPDSLSGAQIDESTLGRVPHAKVSDHAGSADSADSATSADTANSANSAKSAAQLDRGAGNRVFTAGNEGMDLGSNSPMTLATLDLPAGRYLLMASGRVSTSSNAATVDCGIYGPSIFRPAGKYNITNPSSGPWSISAPDDLPNGGKVSVLCSAVPDGFAQITQLNALQVGLINP